MNALFALTVANIKSYVRDRAALFWTLAFPLIFIFMFGFIFQGGGGGGLTLGWVDEDSVARVGTAPHGLHRAAIERARGADRSRGASRRCRTARSTP